MRKSKSKKFLIPLFVVTISGIIYLSMSTFNGQVNKQIGNNHNDLHTSNIIFNFFRDSGYIIYPSSDSSKGLLKTAVNLSSRFKNSNLKLIADTSLTKDELENSNIILLGTYHSNKILKLFNDKLPVKFEDGNFQFLNKSYHKTSDLVDFKFPNPFNNKKSLFIISGNNDSLIAANFSFSYSGDLRIRDGFETLILTDFIKDSENKWKVDYNNFWDFENQIDTILTTKNYTYISHSPKINKAEVETIAVLNEKSVASFQKLVGNSLKPIHIFYNLYNSLEEKSLIINNSRFSNIDESNESVHSVINNFIKGDDFTQDAILLLRQNFGVPKLKFLETGMSVYLGRNWRGFDYKFWASKLFLSNNIPPLNELLDNQKSKVYSYLLTQPLAGAFIDFLIKKFDIKNLMDKYSNWNPASPEINKLNNEWRNYLLELSKKYKQKINHWDKDFTSDMPKFLKGISYAHMGYNIYNGYLSKESFNSLERLKKIGVNAISIMPFTSLRYTNKPEPLDFWESPFAENDESLIYLKNASTKLNFVVMLKPQIWLRDGWPGDISMSNKKDWDKFFDYYYKWISHYAMLAEMYKIKILCIGNELSKSTQEHEDKWIEIAGHIRKLYSGKITYGANWDDEFENLKFWKHFDYIGISQYYPLSKKENPSYIELLAGADSVINHIHFIQEKFGIPVLFTEAGYKNTLQPWKTVFEKNLQPDSTFENQARCYDALMNASYGKKWIAGMFWWKWPSYLGYTNITRTDYYVPLDKPAENIIKKWYSKSWN